MLQLQGTKLQESLCVVGKQKAPSLRIISLRPNNGIAYFGGDDEFPVFHLIWALLHRRAPRLF